MGTQRGMGIFSVQSCCYVCPCKSIKSISGPETVETVNYSFPVWFSPGPFQEENAVEPRVLPCIGKEARRLLGERLSATSLTQADPLCPLRAAKPSASWSSQRSKVQSVISGLVDKRLLCAHALVIVTLNLVCCTLLQSKNCLMESNLQGYINRKRFHWEFFSISFMHVTPKPGMSHSSLTIVTASVTSKMSIQGT